MRSFVLLLFTIFLLSMSSREEGKLYQVVSSHPEDVMELEGFIETVHQDGRLWIVSLKENAPVGIEEHLRPISGRETSYVVNTGNLFNRHARSFREQQIANTLRNADSESIRKDVEHLASYTTRYSGTLENQTALKFVESRFQMLGYKLSRSCYKEDFCNVIAEKVGSKKAEEVLLVVAHIDSVGLAFAGADDNGSGIAVMLEMARLLQFHSNQRTLRFVVSNGEEQWMAGSRHYVTELKRTKQLEQIKFVINMDMVGYNVSDVIEIETQPEFESEAVWMASLASQYTYLVPRVTLGAWGSDHLPFLNAGIPALMTIQDWNNRSPCYHQACDRPEILNYSYAAEVAKLNTAALMSKDRRL